MTDLDRNLAHCAAEIASAEAELRAGNRDVAGLTRADWEFERRLIEAEAGE